MVICFVRSACHTHHLLAHVHGFSLQIPVSPLHRSALLLIPHTSSSSAMRLILDGRLLITECYTMMQVEHPVT